MRGSGCARSLRNTSGPRPARAMWQIVNTLVPYFLLWYLMYHVKEISLWLTIPLAMLAGTLLVRVFIIFHDCGHGSFFKSRGPMTSSDSSPAC